MKKIFVLSKAKRFLSLFLTLLLGILDLCNISTFAASIPQKQNSISTEGKITPYAVDGYNQYFANLSNYSDPHVATVQFSNPRLFISINASKGSYGNATGVLLTLKQPSLFGYKTVFEKRVDTNGLTNTIANGNYSLDPNSPTLIYLNVEGNDICAANISLSIVTNT